MSPPRQAVTARDLSPPPTPVRPSPLARASSIIAQHLPPAPSFPHFDFGSLSPGGGHADPKREPGTSSNGFHFDLPTIRVPEGMQNLKLPEFELPQMNLLPAWQQFRSRFQAHHDEQELPPVPELVLEGYEPKGAWKQMGDWRVYVVGPDPSLDCLIGVYDIFGPSLQTIQGADILHHLTGSTVYIPDFFHSHPFPTTHFPPETPEQVKELQVFFEGRANIDDCADGLVAFGRALRERFRRTEGEEGERVREEGEGMEGAEEDEQDGDDWERWVRVGCYGISWGGKLTFIAGSGSNPFYAVASITPAFVTILDAEALKVPLGLFLSKDEPADVGQKIVDLLRWKTFSSKCTVKTWSNMSHGFAGARGNLRSEEVSKAYVDLYSSLARFFIAARHLDPTSPTRAHPPTTAGAGGGEVRAVEDDVGRRGVEEGETVESKVKEKEKGKERRGWFGRVKKRKEGSK